jgi:4'-phosphopantetheinyl transferase
VWHADLEALADGLEELLCPAERRRASAIRGERDKRLWIRSRGVLRLLLARYLQRDPRALRFSLGPHGKPELQAIAPGLPQADTPESGLPKRALQLHFNLSHSSTIALYAVSADRAVGIDVELPRRQIDELAIAARVLGSEQARRLAGLDPPARTREFLRAWVAHEAAVKCLGTGLGMPAEGATGDLWSAELDVGPDAAAAVAATAGQYELRCWEWSG